MNYMTKKDINKRIKEHSEIISKQEQNIFGVFLQGSQNYIDDLFSEDSDVDSRAIFVPNFRQICLAEDISQRELILDNDEHIDRFDIRKLLKLILTPGINNFEILFTDYYVVNPAYQEYYQELLNIREEIARINESKFIMSSMGITNRDYKTLTKRIGNQDYDIDNFGYSRKRLSNMMRFEATMKAYIDEKPFKDCLKALPQETIYQVRRTHLYKEKEALELADQINQNVKMLADNFKQTQDNLTTKKKVEDIIINLLNKSIKINE